MNQHLADQMTQTWSIDFVKIVLGHADYYPRFGFVPASRYGLKSQWEGIPNEAFMITVFDQDVLSGAHGVASYRDEFNEAMDERNKAV